MSEFENQYKVCMELIKQKSREVSETDIIINGDERPTRQIRDGRKKVEALQKKRRCPCFNFTSLHCCPVSLF